VILLALLVPAFMMAVLFGVTAFEDHLFLHPTASDIPPPPSDEADPEPL